MSERPRPLHRLLWLGRGICAGGPAGFIAGFVFLGIGSRLAMRVVTLLSPASARGLETEAGAVVGEVTAGGTLFLVGAGTMVGVGLGLLYMLVRRWLPGRRPLVYAAVVVALAGSRLVEGHNPDFTELGVPVLNVLVFYVLLVLYGVAVVPLADLLDRKLPTDGAGRVARTFYVLALVPVVALIVANGTASLNQGLVIIALLVIVLGLTRWPSALRYVRFGFWGLCGAGLVFDVIALVEIFGGP